MKNAGPDENPRADRGARSTLLTAVALIGALAAAPAEGQGTGGWTVHPYLQDRWNIRLGVFYPNVDTSARLDSTTFGVGTQVNFEDDLDLEDRKVMGTILASMRLGERWRIEAEYFALKRDGVRQLSTTINWGDSSYTVGTVVSSEFDSSIYRLSGGYSFIKDDQRELGIALGLHVTDFEASIAASGVGAEAEGVLAPLPTIGAYGAYAFTPRWLLSGRVDFFSLNYDGYDGSLTNFHAGVEYQFTRTFGVGVGYQYIKYDLDVMDDGWNGNVTYKFSGPSLFAVASF